jgi:carboxyl-terminal processing protease
MRFSGTELLVGALLAVVVFGAGTASGIYLNEQGNVPPLVTGILTSHLDTPPPDINLGPLWRAWNTLDERFVPASSTEALTNEDKVWGLISGLTDAYGDPYTVFLPPEDNEIFQADISGSFEGVGMEIGIREGVLTVVAPLKGSPALRAGLRSGDQILKINGESTDGIAVDQAVKLIRGPRGTTVRFSVARDEAREILEIPVVRDVIEIPTLETEVKDGVFIISLYNFSAVSGNLFRNALRDFIVSGTPKLILDLRGNPGGYLEAAVDMASWFLPSGKIIVTEDYGKSGKPQVHRSRGYDIFNENLEMVILVNGGSASASEILAGALQEYDIATVIGERTFGKGSVQELVDITDDASLKITIARWLTPNGRSISEKGLDPDILVPRTEEDAEADRDPQLERAIEYLNNE